QLRDRDGAIEALKAYTALDPYDQVAQAQMIDLYAASDPHASQSADAKIDYFRGLLKQEKLSADVRAHVGYRLAKELLARGQQSEAQAANDEALKLCPLDPDALELNAQFMSTGKPGERVNSYLGLLRGNPAQPTVAARLADELAD